MTSRNPGSIPHHWAALPLVFLLIGGCGVRPPSDKEVPQHASTQPTGLDSIRQRCSAFVQKRKTIGLAVAVVSPGEECVLTFGRPALSSKTEIDGDSLFEIGSITKTFTALALQREIERGTMRLDQPIAELLPEGVILPPAARGVTFRQLVTHTSGFPGLPGNFSMWHAMGKMMTNDNPYAGYTEAQFREGIRTVKLESKPGTHFDYSNFGMDLLGYILCKHAGLEYDAYIKREVCEPLGMHDTAAILSAEQSKRFVLGYDDFTMFGKTLSFNRAAPWDLPTHEAGSGALRSSARDMLIYLKANMHPAGPLAGALAQSHRKLYSDDDISIGMNWIRDWDPDLHKVIVWHNGETGGFSSFMAFTEDGKVGVVVLSNVAESVDELGGDILAELAKSSAASK